MSETNNGIPIEVEPTITLQASVNMGGKASENNAEAWAVGERGGVPVSSTDQTYHNNAKYYAQAAEDAAETASAAYGTDLLAPTYSATKTYAVGDHVIYDGGYYVCNTAITTAEAWTAAHWTKLTVGGEASDLKLAINTVVRESHDYMPLIRKTYDSANPSGVDSDKVLVTECFNCNEKPLYFYYKNTLGTFLACCALHCNSDGSYAGDGGRLDTLAGGEASDNFTSGYRRMKFWMAGNPDISDANKEKLEKAIKYTLYYGMQDYSNKSKNLTERVTDNETNIAGNTASADLLDKKTDWIQIPELRNGSAGNYLNPNIICTKYIIPINFGDDTLTLEYIGDQSLADSYAFSYCLFHGATDGMTTTAAFSESSIGKSQYNDMHVNKSPKPYIVVDTADLKGYEHIAVSLERYMNGTPVPLRIADDQESFRLTYGKGTAGSADSIDYSAITKTESEHELHAAQHVRGNAITPLTLVHFSDLHGDQAALSRITEEAQRIEADDTICTGDMVYYRYEEISSWWNPDVLTCIGNHDSAWYDSETGYDWTALSMANRDAYYITPFKSYWGITHTSGTSYYYKDYNSQKVRLIVMDVMLYMDNGAEAAAQTSWLNSLLSDAITNNLHVMIALHSPHGGATPVDCSFSRYNETTMPTHDDCNTPQALIDAVAAKITDGLHFIGYLVGHTHQDNIWDAEGDGKQLMYCVTTAMVADMALWRNSDQYRSKEADAFNIVVIDTVNTIVKLIRGGGADIDDHMRTRKAICFNYSTGEKVGDVL